MWKSVLESLADFLDINDAKKTNLTSWKCMESCLLETVKWATQPWLSLVSCLLLNQFLTCKEIFPSWVVSCVCHFPANIHRMPATSLPEVIKLPFDHAENIFFSCLIHCSSFLTFGSLTMPSLSPHFAHSYRKLLSILHTFMHYAFPIPLTATCLRVSGPCSGRSCYWVLEMGSVWLERWEDGRPSHGKLAIHFMLEFAFSSSVFCMWPLRAPRLKCGAVGNSWKTKSNFTKVNSLLTTHSASCQSILSHAWGGCWPKPSPAAAQIAVSAWGVQTTFKQPWKISRGKKR